MALEDLFALEEHARAAGAGELGEEALIEEVRRRYRQQGSGSLVDLLTDEELGQARRRPTEYERVLAMLDGASELERELRWIRSVAQEHEAVLSLISEDQERRRIRLAKQKGGLRRDPLRNALVAFIASRISSSDYFNSSTKILSWLQRMSPTLPDGISIKPADSGGLLLTGPDGRSKRVARSTFRRYATDARNLQKKAAQ